MHLEYARAATLTQIESAAYLYRFCLYGAGCPFRAGWSFYKAAPGFPFHPSRKQPPSTHRFVIARLCEAILMRVKVTQSFALGDRFVSRQSAASSQ